MEPINKKIESFLFEHLGIPYQQKKIEGSASDRNNYKVTNKDKSFILTEGKNIEENETFFQFAAFFSEIGDFTPRVLAINSDKTIYLQENVGEINLLEVLKTNGENSQTQQLFKKTLDQLVQMQVKGKEGIDANWCYDFSHFNYITATHDLYYFKNYFLDLLDINYNKNKLLLDFDLLAKKIDAVNPTYFMHRDFQSRNIMVKDEKVSVIDFQGGMMGVPVYDLISLTWQSRANLSNTFKQELKDYYFNQFNKAIKQPLSDLDYENQYQLCLVIRLLQVLGAYGFRGIYQKKPQFTESIFEGIKNLSHLVELPLLKELPYLKKIITEITQLPEEKIKSIIYANS